MSRGVARRGYSQPHVSRIHVERDHTWQSHLINYLVIALFVAILLYPLLIGRTLYWGDISLYFEPMQYFARDVLRQGRLPLWNPYIMCGQPYIGNPQTAVFYPFSLLAPFLTAPKFISWYVLLHMYLCGAFMYLYLQRHTRSSRAALVGGLVYVGSSCLVSRLQFPTMVGSAPYFPLLLALIDRYIAKPSLGCWLGIGVSIGLLVLAGHPQMAYLTLLTCSLYALWQCISPSSPSEHGIFSAKSWQSGNLPRMMRARVNMPIIFQLCLAVVVGICVAAVQLIPIVEMTISSTRERMTPFGANRFYLDLSHLGTLLFPHLFGHPATADYHGGGNAWEPAIFIGWLPLVAIGLALYKLTSDVRHTRFWLWAAIITLWLSTGIAGGLFWIAFYLIPGLANFHDPARFLVISTVAACFLTAQGVDRLLFNQTLNRKLSRNGLSTIAILLTAIPLIGYGWEWNPTRSNDIPDAYTSTAMVPPTVRSYLPAHDSYWKRFISDSYSDYGPESNLRSVVNSGMSNTQMMEHIETAAGYEPVPITASAEFDGLTRLAFLRDEPTLSVLVRLMGVSDVYLTNHHFLYSADVDTEQQLKGDIRVLHPSYIDADGTELRAWTVPYARHVEGKLRIQSALCDPGFDPDMVAIVSGLRKDMEPLVVPEFVDSANLSRPKTLTKIVDRNSNSVLITANAGSTNAILIYSSACFPGWHAYLDGKRMDILCVDGAFIGLQIGPGSHTVQLVYEPQSLYLGIYVLCASIAFLAGTSGWCVVRRIGHGGGIAHA